MTRLAFMVPVAALLLSGCQKEAPIKDERRAVFVQQIGAGNGAGAITYAGEIRSAFESQLGFQVAGRIVERSVNAGDHVRSGQALARIDSSDYARALDSAAAQTGAAQTAAATQRADLARSRELLKQGFISPAEFDQQQASTDQAQAQLRASAAQRGTAAAQLGRTVLTAPRDGIVTDIQGEVGQVVGAGQAVVTFADGARPEVAISLPEDGIGAIRRAKRLRVSVWSDPGVQYEAKLRTIAGAADPTTRTFAARLSVVAPAQALRMGETAELHIQTDGGAASVLVPLTAIAQAGGKTSAWVLDRRTMTVQPRAVKIGRASEDRLTILSGLKPGETIVTAGVHLLRAGEKVRIAEVPQS